MDGTRMGSRLGTLSSNGERIGPMSAPITLYDPYEVVPDVQSVAEPERARRTYVKAAAKTAGGYVLTGLAILAVTLSLHLWLDPGVMDDRWDGIQGFAALMLWGLAGVFSLTIFPYMLYCAVRCLLVACVAPDTTTPKATVKAFLNSTRSSLNERAYNLLTDQARSPGKVELGGGLAALARRMPAIEIHDLESFERFWVAMDVLSWTYRTGRIRCEEHDSESVVITVPAKAKGRRDGKIRFEVRFAAVRRASHWYLANGFVWPEPPS